MRRPMGRTCHQPHQEREKMAGAKIISEGVFTDFLTPIIPKIGREPTIEALIELHQLISGNVPSVA